MDQLESHMSREYNRVPLCVLLLLIKDNKIFLIKRSETGWADGAYAIPGGCVDAGEPFKQACVREGFEELGVTVNPEDLTIVQTSHVKRDTELQYVMVSFATDTWIGQPYNKEPHKHSDAQWFDIDSLPVNINQFAKEIIRAYQQQILYAEYGW